jgi:hypothetical protein
LLALGHECSIVSSSKSGKESVRWSHANTGSTWWPGSPDIVVKDADLLQTLESFDRVIMNDMICTPLDGVSTKEERPMPAYVKALLNLTIPWAPIAHGNPYGAKQARFVPELLQSPALKAVFTLPAPYDYSTHPVFSEAKDLLFPLADLPYDPRFSVNTPITENHVIGMMGRFVAAKGPHVLGLAALRLRNQTIEFWGSAPASARPSDAFLLYEELVRQGSESLEAPARKGNTSPWMVRTPTNSTVTYYGAYHDGSATGRRMATYVNLTNPTFTAGSEYAVLEAMDAGAIPLVPRHIMTGGHTYLEMPTFTAKNTPSGVLKDPQILNLVAAAVTRAQQLTDETRRDVALKNREALRDHNSPKKIMSTMMEVLG